jgi:hypothetical protein
MHEGTIAIRHCCGTNASQHSCVEAFNLLENRCQILTNVLQHPKAPNLEALAHSHASPVYNLT